MEPLSEKELLCATGLTAVEFDGCGARSITKLTLYGEGHFDVGNFAFENGAQKGA